MPLYDYECTAKSCEASWEAQQKIADPVLTECPVCHRPTAVRVIRATGGFALKGPGWARDGYATATMGARAK
jgi:putative FmdB family regulatory protein